MNKVLSVVLFAFAWGCATAHAQQAKEFDHHVVHYNALNSNLITPQVALSYGIKRSSSRALLNITVLSKSEDQAGAPVAAEVTASARNLTGQVREIEVREIKDAEGAIYYIGELSVRNMETFDFTVMVRPAGSQQDMEVKFRQQFYTE